MRKSPVFAGLSLLAVQLACVDRGTSSGPPSSATAVDATTPSQDAGGDGGGTSVLVGGIDSGPVIQAPAVDAAIVNPGVLDDAGPLDSAVSMGDAGSLEPICSSEPNDTACALCGQSSCCREMYGCNAECRAVGVCVAKCTNGDNDCIQACGAAATDQATDQYNAILNCYNAKCQVACGG